MSGSGIAANMPKRPGKSRAMLAPNSLQSRARVRAAALPSSNQMPGLVIEHSAVAMPAFSICSSEKCGVQPV